MSEKSLLETFLPDMRKAIAENVNSKAKPQNPLSIAFNNMFKAANSVASCLDQISVSLSQVLFESDENWLKRLKQIDMKTFNLFREIVGRLKHLNDAIANYEHLKEENNGDVSKIIIDKSIVDDFLDYIPDVKKRMAKILTPPENSQIIDVLEKVKNTYFEFMAKAKYLIEELREIDRSIKTFEEIYGSQIPQTQPPQTPKKHQIP